MATLLVIVFGAVCFAAGALVGSRNHAQITEDVSKIKADLQALRYKLHSQPASKVYVAGSSVSTSPLQGQDQSSN